MTKTKIFISIKDKHKAIKSDIISSIQTGRAIADEIFDDMIGDDTGDNISERNPRFNELTAQYWVWKHYEEIGNPDYVGFMHYRRHFIFDGSFNTGNKKPWLPGAPVYITEGFDENCKKNISDENISKMVAQGYECYVMKKYDINLFENNDLYMKEHYICTIPGAKRIVWDKFYNIVKTLYPQYQEILDKFSYGHTIHCCNMFIMSKDLFYRYNEFCFNILCELEKQVDYRFFDSTQMRFIGYIGEYVLTLFVMILEQENRKIKYLDAIYIENYDNKKRSFTRNLFAMENRGIYKVINILGIKIKIKNKYNQLLNLAIQQDYMIRELSSKISELQEEIILNKHQG
ncbi:DUF4422 domain-containing protein [bacterium]|nr:DUF4422 domain-containing protein [bacterium]